VGNSIDYGMWVYDPRVGRFMSVDPLTKKYPFLTPYQYASNRPIDGVDLDGLEWNSQSTFVYKVTPVLKKDNVYTVPPPREPDVLMVDVYGRGVIGKQSDVKAEVNAAWAENFERVGDNVKSGFGGSIGYLANGPRGAAIGAAADQIMLSFGGFPGETNLSPRYEPPYESNLTGLAKNRFLFARQFYEQAGYAPERALDHVSGIDLSKPVFDKLYSKGTVLEQWRRVNEKTGELFLATIILYLVRTQRSLVSTLREE